MTNYLINLEEYDLSLLSRYLSIPGFKLEADVALGSNTYKYIYVINDLGKIVNKVPPILEDILNDQNTVGHNS